MSTFHSDSSGGSSTSSERYNLDENDKKDILVYKYRSKQPDGASTSSLEISSQPSLAKWLDSECDLALQSSNMRVSRKKIPRGNSRVDVRMEDLFCEPERSAYAKYPSSKNSLANIGLPSRVYWKRLLFNEFPDLYIVSPVSSPENSANNSPEASQHVTPSNTFERDRKRNGDGERVDAKD